MLLKPRGTTGGGGGYTPCAEGEWPAVCTYSFTGESQSGNQRVEIHLEVTDDNRTHKLKCWVPLSVDWRVDNLIEALGNDEPNGLDADNLEGRQCMAIVYHKVDGQKVWARVDKLQRHPDGPIGTKPAAMEEDDDCPF